MTAQCTYCRRRAVTYYITRKGGGTYRRGGREYPNHLCLDCVQTLLAGNEHRHGWESVQRYGIGSLRRIVESAVTRSVLTGESGGTVDPNQK